MKKYFFLIFFLASFLTINAQDNYKHSIGLRGGPLIGVSYKNFIWPINGVLEVIGGFNFVNGRHVSLTGLYEHHLFINYSTNFYGGGGISFGNNNEQFFLQLETIVGIEYLLDFVPFNVSLDYKPGYSIIDNRLVFNEFGVSLRYIIQ